MTYAIDETLLAKARELGPLIREHAPQAERERRLSKPVIDALNRSGITKMLLPKSLGGLEADPVTMLRVVEEIASFDSVAGWLLMVSNSGAFTGCRFPAETVEELFRDPNDWFIGTAFQPPVEAREVDGGYRLTGQRALASFAHSSRWICLTGLVMDGPAPRMAHGMPVLIVAMMPAKDVEVLDTWNALGMRGSDSTDVSVKDLFVPSAFTCPAFGIPTVIPYCCETVGSDAVGSIRPNSIGGPSYLSRSGSSVDAFTVCVGNLIGAPARTQPGAAGIGAPSSVSNAFDTPL